MIGPCLEIAGKIFTRTTEPFGKKHICNVPQRDLYQIKVDLNVPGMVIQKMYVSMFIGNPRWLILQCLKWNLMGEKKEKKKHFLRNYTNLNEVETVY